MLDRHLYDLDEYLKNGQTVRDKGLFVESLESTIHHLHVLGWVHNNIHLSNIMALRHHAQSRVSNRHLDWREFGRKDGRRQLVSFCLSICFWEEFPTTWGTEEVNRSELRAWLMQQPRLTRSPDWHFPETVTVQRLNKSLFRRTE